MPSKKIKEWLDALEVALERDAERAGLLSHGTSIGTAREFLIQGVLRSLLPSCVRIGAGMILDGSNDQVSKQIDIILFDSRTPAFEIHDGLGLYPVEGVLATIEVKSTLTKRTLREALENCRSVLELSGSVLPDGELSDAVKSTMQRENLTQEKALEMVRFDLKPATYVFSFRSSISLPKFRETIENWFKDAGFPSDFQGTCPRLPRIVAGGKILGILRDAWIQPHPTEHEQYKLARAQCGGEPLPLMGTIRSEHRFGWLACHLLHTIARRLVLPHGRIPLRYTMNECAPAMYYVEEMQDSPVGEIIWWNRASLKGRRNDGQ